MSTQGDRASQDAGFTLVEVNVALLVVLTAGGLLLSCYLFAVRWFEDRRQAIAVENDLHLILQRLVLDLAYADQVIPEPDGAWRLTFASGRSHVYHWQDRMLQRDGLRMHEAGVAVDTFRLVPYGPSTVYSLPVAQVPERDSTRVIVRVQVALAARRHRRRATTAVALRQERPWEPALLHAEPEP